MAKGDDAVTRKRSRAHRKKGRSLRSKESVSARIAAIIAAKRRRKSGKRRVCEGMCFTLPTPEDPFNDRNDPKVKNEGLQRNADANEKKRKKGAGACDSSLFNECSRKSDNTDGLPASPKPASAGHNVRQQFRGKCKGGGDSDSDDCLSKYLILCLKAIQESWCRESKVEEDGYLDQRGMGRQQPLLACKWGWTLCRESKVEEDGYLDQRGMGRQQPLLACKWGIDFWKSCSSGLDIVDSSGPCANREQVAWLVSTASNIIAMKEKECLLVSSPFLVFLVPSQEKATEIRSVCKPLKSLGVHTVSLHPGASIDHQVHGLKSCEPEFVVSTPERLLDLVTLKALDISGVSLLVVDGLESLIACGFLDAINSIREHISGDPQTIVFNDKNGEASFLQLQSLLKEPVCRVSLHSSMSLATAM